jgi:hypothetical protein
MTFAQCVGSCSASHKEGTLLRISEKFGLGLWGYVGLKAIAEQDNRRTRQAAENRVFEMKLDDGRNQVFGQYISAV